MIQMLNQNNFQDAVNSNTPILVDFWATWCAPCMMQGEILHQLDTTNPNLKIGKVNVDECRNLAAQFQISAIPTMILFQNGQILERVTGLQNAGQIQNLFKKHGGS